MIYRFLFGDDIFISYSRYDGSDYATSIAKSLTEAGYSCRFDQWATSPGKSIPPEIIRAVRNSAMLVVVGTEGAGKSDAVEEEVAEFLKTRRRIVPIDVDGTLRQAKWWHLLEGLLHMWASRIEK